METVLPILCLLLGIALPVGVLYLVVRRAWRQLAVAEAYRVVAQRLGLSVDTRGVSVHGYLAGRRLYIGEVMTSYGPERRTEYRGVLGLGRPLGLGLLVRRRASRGWLRRRAKAQAVRLGDEEFDKLFEVFGDDEAGVRGVLDEAMRQSILAFVKRWPGLTLTDHHVRVLLRQPEASANALGALVSGVQDLADRLVDARTRVPAPAALADVVPVWQELATAWALELEPWLPAMAGTIDGHAIQVAARREQAGFAAEVRVGLAAHRNVGLRLTPQVEPDGYWSVGQDIQVGDEDFDRAFVIKGWDPFAVRALLADDVRTTLLGLVHGRGVQIDANDREIRARRVALDADAVRTTVEDLLRVASGLGW